MKRKRPLRRVGQKCLVFYSFRKKFGPVSTITDVLPRKSWKLGIPCYRISSSGMVVFETALMPVHRRVKPYA